MAFKNVSVSIEIDSIAYVDSGRIEVSGDLCSGNDVDEGLAGKGVTIYMPKELAKGLALGSRLLITLIQPEEGT